MGDISIIARRLCPNYVQYGWSGNGGYFSSVEMKLLEWYNTHDEELIDYLFSLGQLSNIGKPGSEKGGCAPYYTHDCTNQNHYVGRTERSIFSKIAFIDYGYFYDADKEWYYVRPGPFRIKMPLELVACHLDENYHEFSFVRQIQKDIIDYIFTEYKDNDSKLLEVLSDRNIDPSTLKDELIADEFPIERLFKRYKAIFQYFDDWILVVTSQDKQNVERFIVRPKMATHIETIEWLEQF